MLDGGVGLVNAASYAAVFAIGVVIVVVAYLVVASFNEVMGLRQRIDKAWANIGVALKQRHDELPNVVAAVRGLMAYEQDVLTEVTKARAAYAPSAPIPAQAGVSVMTSAAIRTLFSTVERYPDIKSAANVADLQAETERLEGIIADRRELYNDQVYRYNTRITQLPTMILAALFGWAPREFFTPEPGDTSRPDVSLDLGPGDGT